MCERPRWHLTSRSSFRRFGLTLEACPAFSMSSSSVRNRTDIDVRDPAIDLLERGRHVLNRMPDIDRCQWRLERQRQRNQDGGRSEMERREVNNRDNSGVAAKLLSDSLQDRRRDCLPAMSCDFRWRGREQCPSEERRSRLTPLRPPMESGRRPTRVRRRLRSRCRRERPSLRAGSRKNWDPSKPERSSRATLSDHARPA